MYLVENARARGVISLPSYSNEPLRFAASQLQHYLERCTGAFLPICTEPSDRAVVRFELDPGIGEEAFEVEADESTVNIRGGDGLGSLYGTYHLLKKYCGIIFAGFGPEGEHVPRKASVLIPSGTERHAPLLWYRGTQLICIGEVSRDEMPNWREGAIRRIDWMAKNGMNYLLNWPAEDGGRTTFRRFDWENDEQFNCRDEFEPAWNDTAWFRENLLPEIRKRGMKVEVGTHNMALFLPPSKYYDEHPEYYALRDGKRVTQRVQLMICTSNRDAVEQYTQNVLTYIEENPYISVLGLAQEDGFGMCECPACRAMDDSAYDHADRMVCGTFLNGTKWKYRENQHKSRRYFRLVNHVARRVRERFPHLRINATCYVDIAWPPADMELEDNIYPHVAMYIRCGSHRYDDPACKMNRGLYELAEAWSRAAPGRVYFTEYYNGKSAYRSLPYDIAHRVGEDWRLFTAMGIGGMKNQHSAACNEAYALNTYTFARRAWNTDEPFDRILDDFLVGHFGSKASGVRAIYENRMHTMTKAGQLGRCYHPDADIYFDVFDASNNQEAMSILDGLLAGDCTSRERVQLLRFRTTLEFIERFRKLESKLATLRARGIPCDRSTYDLVIAFLDWEKQHIDTGYFAWGNDVYQWKNAMRGLLATVGT